MSPASILTLVSSPGCCLRRNILLAACTIETDRHGGTSARSAGCPRIQVEDGSRARDQEEAAGCAYHCLSAACELVRNPLPSNLTDASLTRTCRPQRACLFGPPLACRPCGVSDGQRGRTCVYGTRRRARWIVEYRCWLIGCDSQQTDRSCCDTAQLRRM